MIVFGEHDLAQRSPFPHVDLVVSRNVLIYFSGELQRRALQLFAYSLRDGGYLVMGKAESPAPVADLFAPVDRHNKVYRRQGQRFLLPPTLPTSPAPRARVERTSEDRGATGPRYRNYPPPVTRAQTCSTCCPWASWSWPATTQLRRSTPPPSGCSLSPAWAWSRTSCMQCRRRLTRRSAGP